MKIQFKFLLVILAVILVIPISIASIAIPPYPTPCMNECLIDPVAACKYIKGETSSPATCRAPDCISRQDQTKFVKTDIKQLSAVCTTTGGGGGGIRPNSEVNAHLYIDCKWNAEPVFGCCGDTQVDSKFGEECDLGSQNGVQGSGCTSDCKKGCKTDADCTPTDSCKTATCGTNGVCSATTDKPDCTDCGGGKVCISGTCSTVPACKKCEGSTLVADASQDCDVCKTSGTETHHCQSGTCSNLCGNSKIDCSEKCDPPGSKGGDKDCPDNCGCPTNAYITISGSQMAEILADLPTDLDGGEASAYVRELVGGSYLGNIMSGAQTANTEMPITNEITNFKNERLDLASKFTCDCNIGGDLNFIAGVGAYPVTGGLIGIYSGETPQSCSWSLGIGPSLVDEGIGVQVQINVHW